MNVPKGSICGSCNHFDKDCSDLDFESMPVISVSGHTNFVKCTEFSSAKESPVVLFHTEAAQLPPTVIKGEFVLDDTAEGLIRSNDMTEIKDQTWEITRDIQNPIEVGKQEYEGLKLDAFCLYWLQAMVDRRECEWEGFNEEVEAFYERFS